MECFKLFALLLVCVCLGLAVGAPRNKRTYYAGQLTILPGEGPQCVPFKHNYCNCLGYNYTMFPNPARPDAQSLDELIGEFNDFVPLLEANCDEKIGTLLCFLYFPYCDKSTFPPWIPPTAKSTEWAVYPCQDTCESATHPESLCTAMVEGSPAREWGKHLKCNYTVNDGGHQVSIYKSGDTCSRGDSSAQLCSVDGSTMPQGSTEGPDEKTEEPAEEKSQTTEESGEEESKATETEPAEEQSHTTEEPTEAMEEPTTVQSVETTQKPEKCPRGNFRNKCTANIFKKNCYTFAARVQVTSVTAAESNNNYIEIGATKVVQYDLKSRVDSNDELVLAPSMADSIVLTTNWFEHCDDCPQFEIGTEYLVAGTYSQTDSEVTWHLRCDSGKENTLVTKLDSNPKDKCKRKLPSWVDAGNAVRSGKNAPEC